MDRDFNRKFPRAPVAAKERGVLRGDFSRARMPREPFGGRVHMFSRGEDRMGNRNAAGLSLDARAM